MKVEVPSSGVPRLVALHITPVCSHRCPFCYASDDQHVSQGHPKFQVLRRVVDELSRAGVEELSLLGGDPACYPDVIPLAKHASESGMSVSILSNTLTFPHGGDELAAEYIDSFETTVHHYMADEHDAFCCAQGAYKRVVGQLKKFADLGKKTGVAINVTPMTATIVAEMVRSLVVDYGIPLDYVIVQRIIPFGRAAGSSEFTLSRMHVERALEGIDQAHRELGVNVVMEDPFPLCIIPHKYWPYMQRCEWGYTKASVSADGGLSRCGADPRYRLGNVLETSLKELWTNSVILRSFREKEYLPGRCRVCDNLEDCGGGCPLSCEIEKDHGIDYLCAEFDELDAQIHGELEFAMAARSELSSILQIEWGNFQGYGHLFTVESIQKWYDHIPDSFYVVRDSHGWVLAYAVLVPISQTLFERICRGDVSSLPQFPQEDVGPNTSDYWHLEVLASVPKRSASRVGAFLVRKVGEQLLCKAKYVTTSPITPIGERLCRYFGFEHTADEDPSEGGYPVYMRRVDPSDVVRRLQRF